MSLARTDVSPFLCNNSPFFFIFYFPSILCELQFHSLSNKGSEHHHVKAAALFSTLSKNHFFESPPSSTKLLCGATLEFPLRDTRVRYAPLPHSTIHLLFVVKLQSTQTLPLTHATHTSEERKRPILIFQPKNSIEPLGATFPTAQQNRSYQTT